jgi:hypothetical protein
LPTGEARRRLREGEANASDPFLGNGCPPFYL